MKVHQWRQGKMLFTCNLGPLISSTHLIRKGASFVAAPGAVAE